MNHHIHFFKKGSIYLPDWQSLWNVFILTLEIWKYMGYVDISCSCQSSLRYLDMCWFKLSSIHLAYLIFTQFSFKVHYENVIKNNQPLHNKIIQNSYCRLYRSCSKIKCERWIQKVTTSNIFQIIYSSLFYHPEMFIIVAGSNL